jgi:hypothetical protein
MPNDPKDAKDAHDQAATTLYDREPLQERKGEIHNHNVAAAIWQQAQPELYEHLGMTEAENLREQEKYRGISKVVGDAAAALIAEADRDGRIASARAAGDPNADREADLA